MPNITINTDILTDTEKAIAEFLAAKVRQTEEEKEAKKPWMPELREKYFAIYSSGKIVKSTWYNDTIDMGRYKLGNCFKTEEEAGFAVECIKVVAELHRYAKEHNSPKFDRNIRGCEKWYPIYDQTINKIVFGYSKYMLNSEEMFETERIAKAAVKEIGEDRLKKYYFGVK